LSSSPWRPSSPCSCQPPTANSPTSSTATPPWCRTDGNHVEQSRLASSVSRVSRRRLRRQRSPGRNHAEARMISSYGWPSHGQQPTPHRVASQVFLRECHPESAKDPQLMRRIRDADPSPPALREASLRAEP